MLREEHNSPTRCNTVLYIPPGALWSIIYNIINETTASSVSDLVHAILECARSRPVPCWRESVPGDGLCLWSRECAPGHGLCLWSVSLCWALLHHSLLTGGVNEAGRLCIIVTGTAVHRTSNIPLYPYPWCSGSGTFFQFRFRIFFWLRFQIILLVLVLDNFSYYFSGKFRLVSDPDKLSGSKSESWLRSVKKLCESRSNLKVWHSNSI